MKITILNGSSRKQSQSGKIARFIDANLRAKAGVSTYYLSLENNPLPLWDESIWEDAPTWKIWNPIKAELQSSDAFVFVVPEWSGMVPPAVKNFFLLCSHQELGHKPALIVAVSSSRGGAYPVNELRISSYKNTRLLYLPEHFIIRDVEKMFNGETPASEDDKYLRLRLDYCLNLLQAYGKCMKEIRSSGVIDHKTFPNGM
ncbi:MAG TPA: NAD(P)H-dependent oxidoreductase [Oligoflexus sp.]|uniref:NADPH-dependent FMN reductase n=1 Tax=Oligoflexus sp. TaxID=1971216 RepID=UPI002D7FAE77|nr:NAD(P)H-dependent oxidoreductase [Oligoflexus sp.]HET9240547.1 NAD(P)H-dependent oxidoreductase [Oligoflexus sp.]